MAKKAGPRKMLEFQERAEAGMSMGPDDLLTDQDDTPENTEAEKETDQ